MSILYRGALGNSNQAIIFQNKDDRDQLSKLVPGVSSISITIPGSGVDLSKFILKPASLGFPIVMLASRLLKEKGVYEFVKAAELVNQQKKNARFLIVGNTDHLNPSSVRKTELDYWQDKGIIEWIGWSDGMQDIISTAAIVALPSYYGEGLPKILIEAAACGRAVVTTDHPGCRDAIQEGETGLLVPVKDANALACAIKLLLDNPQRCADMGRAGRKRAEEIFDLNMVVEKHIEIYEELLTNC